MGSKQVLSAGQKVAGYDFERLAVLKEQIIQPRRVFTTEAPAKQPRNSILCRGHKIYELNVRILSGYRVAGRSLKGGITQT
jgi:hypothetical protein